MGKKHLLAAAVILLAAGGVIGLAIRAGSAAEKKPLKFGATYMTMDNPYFAVLDENIKDVVEGNGDILISRDPLQDQDKQNQQIEDMIAEGIDLLFLNPVNWKQVKPAIDLCRENNVPVIVVDTNVYGENEEKIIVSTITSDNYNAGVQCAKDMMKKRNQARIVILNHNEVNSTNQRVQGFLDTITGNDNYRVTQQRWVATELGLAMDEMKDIINCGTEYDVVLGGNDPSALGCLAAMQMMRAEGDILLYGIDGSPDAKVMIRAGYMEGTSAQSPIQIARTAAETAYEHLAGEAVEESIVIPVEMITKENLKDYDVDGWQ